MRACLDNKVHTSLFLDEAIQYFPTMNTAQIPPAEEALDVAATCVDQHVDDVDEHVVDFDSPDDPENPLNWSSQYKWSVVMLISIMSLVV